MRGAVRRVEFLSTMNDEKANLSRGEIERIHSRLDELESETRWLRWLLAGTLALLFVVLTRSFFK